MTHTSKLFSLLCLDLGLAAWRLPTLFECEVAKKRLLHFAEHQDVADLIDLRDWLGSWCSTVEPLIINHPSGFKRLYQVVTFLLKVKTPITIQMRKEYVSSLLAIEKENRSFVPNSESNVLLIARWLLRCARIPLDLSANSVVRSGAHGPGAVRERASGDEKAYYLLRNCRQWSGYAGYHWHLSSHLVYNKLKESNAHKAWPYAYGEPLVRAKLGLVAKTWKGPRGTFTSPTAAMFLQKGQDAMIRKFVASNWMSNCWDPEDQRPSQMCALSGSKDRSWATLDLKDASDRITKQLTRYLFRRRDYIALMATRPSVIELPSGESFKPTFLSPMGDGKTFAVLSLVCIIVSVAAILAADGHTIGRRPILWESIKRASEKVRVFGDDIAVHAEYYEAVIRGLKDAGLKVNINKSFCFGLFRESCGCDAFKGVDVTPFRLKENLDGHWTMKVLQSVKDLHNRIVQRAPALDRTARYLEQLILLHDKTVVYTNDACTSSGLYTSCVHTARIKNLRLGRRSRFDPGTWDWQWLGTVVKEVNQPSDPTSDWYRYNNALFPSSELRFTRGSPVYGDWVRRNWRPLESINCRWNPAVASRHVGWLNQGDSIPIVAPRPKVGERTI